MPQGTVKSFDPEEKTGMLVDDSLAEVPFDRRAFVQSGLLELRLGQRVRFELDEDGDGDPRVTNLNVVSL